MFVTSVFLFVFKKARKGFSAACVHVGTRHAMTHTSADFPIKK